MSWTESDVPDLTGSHYLVTGANSGIGFEATRMLAEAGATVTMACRSTKRAQEAVERIRMGPVDPDLLVEELDLASLESIRAFADCFEDTVDGLINNAGVMAIPRRETDDGFEMQFGVNHLGHFALTGLVLENLAETARIITVSSGIHERGEIDFEDLQGERLYNRWDAYAQSKLANVLFAYELDRRLTAAESQWISVAVHPGYADTGLQQQGPEMEGSQVKATMMAVANKLFAQSAAMGALPTVYAATAPGITGGTYYGPGGLLNMRGPPERQESAEQSYNRETAQRLWEISAELTGVEYALPATQA